MSTFRKILYSLAIFTLAACSTHPLPAPTAVPVTGTPDPLPTEVPAQKHPPAEPGTLGDSIPVAVWQDRADGHLLVPIDPASGQALPDYQPIQIQQAIFHAFSPDQTTLAVVGFEASQNPRDGTLHLINLRTWEDRIQEVQIDGYVNAMAFSPDGKQLAIAHGSGESRILVLDVSKPSIKSEPTMRQTELGFLVYKMKFSTNGSGLMVYGSEIENRYTVNEMSPNPPLVNLFDSADLSLRWEVSLEGVWHGIVPKAGKEDTAIDLHRPGQAIYLFPGLVFAPESDILYVVHPDEEKLTTVDFRAQKFSSVEIKPRLSWIEKLLSLTAGVAHAKIAEGTSKQVAISPNGEFLYIVGQRNDLVEDEELNWRVIENPLGLQIVQAADGSRLAYIDTEASELSISPDGRYLYLRGLSGEDNIYWTQIFDTSEHKLIDRKDGMWLVPTRRADGAPVLASSVWLNEKGEHRNAIVDFEKVLAEWVSSEYLAWLTFP